MNTCPERVGDAKAVWFSPIKPYEPRGFGAIVSYVVVAQYPGEEFAYLFGCTSDWQTVTDSWHQTVAEAIESAVVNHPEVKERGQFTANT